MEWIPESLSELIFGNNPQAWLTALAVFAVSQVVLWIFFRVSLNRLRAFSEGTRNTLDDTLTEAYSKTSSLFLMVLSVWIAGRFLEMPPTIHSVIEKLLLLAALVQATVWMTASLGHLIRHFVRLQIDEDSSQLATTTALTFIGKLALWSLAFLLALENLGFDVTALLTGLGVGGIAVALAAQNILGDLFASLTIMFDKPFVQGDFIIVGDLMGTVEKIGLKTTRIRSLGGEQLVFSNNDLLASRIKNYKRMLERRVVFTLGVTYQTPAEKLEKIPQILKEAVERQELARFDRSHFQSYGDSALVFETVYWMQTPDYNSYMDTQQEINLEAFGAFETEGIEFAYPTRTIHLTGGIKRQQRQERTQPPEAEAAESTSSSPKEKADSTRF